MLFVIALEFAATSFILTKVVKILKAGSRSADSRQPIRNHIRKCLFTNTDSDVDFP